jgi:predicted DNA-binding protein
MNVAVKPTSIRLSSGTQMLLDNAAKQLRRSKSSIVEEALKAQLNRIAEKEVLAKRENAMTILLDIRRRAEAASTGLTSEEIDTQVRNFRGDD